MKTKWLALVLALVLASTASAQVRPEVPIYIQASNWEDGCSINGVVRGLDPHGDGFLAVKSGPSLNFARIDKLHNGAQVYICAQVGDWYGVVYSKKGGLSEYCNVSTPWPRSLPYTGPCSSGWVYRRYIEGFAG